jgi:hypothetical protein
MRNRRSEPRFFADQPVTVTLIDALNTPTCHGTIVDYSASGVALHIPICPDIGWRVAIRWPKGTILAEVRNCHQSSPSSYRVGLKIREITALAEVEGETGAA